VDFNQVVNLLEHLKNIRCRSRGKSGTDVATECIKLVEEKFTPTTNTSVKCKCGADAVYHYCCICWRMEIDSQKQSDTPF
jgi:hypothetical protein